MKNFKRIAGILLALTMLCVMVLPAFAAEKLNLKGSITITDNETVKASEKNFSAYRILNLEVYGDPTTNTIETYSYTVPRDEESLVAFYETYFGLDRDDAAFDAKVVAGIDKIYKEGNIYAFQEAVLVACQGNVAPYNGNIVPGGFQFNPLNLGYYLIVDSATTKPVAALALQTAKPDVTVEIKAEVPTVDKKIDTDHNVTTTDDRVDANEAAIGDTITYVIDSKVPNMFGYDKYFFIMKDTMSKGLTYTEDSMVITIGDKTLVKDVDYTLTTVTKEDGTTDLKIVFNNFIQYNTEEFKEAKIEVSYDAVLNRNCEVNTIPNTNEVYLEYSNNPNVDYEGENEPNEEEKETDPLGETPKAKVETYTTTLEIVKTDPNGKRLQGADFTLTGKTLNTVRIEKESFELDANGNYWKMKDGSYTTTDPESIVDGAPMAKGDYASLTDKYTKTTTTTFQVVEGDNIEVKGTVGEDGILRFEGIPSGEYIITETKAPEGYNKLQDSITVTIEYHYEEVAGEGHVTYTYGPDDTVFDNNGVARVTVKNQMGSELPDTGGVGTTMFYIIGGVLVLAAVVLLVARKRMSAEA